MAQKMIVLLKVPKMNSKILVQLPLAKELEVCNVLLLIIEF